MAARLGLLAMVAVTAAQKGSPYRCRDRETTCQTWAQRGECENNPQYMFEKCPVSCDACENANLLPTPAPFEFDFACNGKLAIAPESFKGTPEDEAPQSCAFLCADKMSAEVCKSAADAGSCTAKKHAKTMRFSCAATCGVCAGLEMAAADRIVPKCASGDKDQGGSCETWAKQGECVNNHGYMKESCQRACGICDDDGQSKVPMGIALRKSTTVRKKTKAKKATGDPQPGGGESESSLAADDAQSSEAAAGAATPADAKGSVEDSASTEKEQPDAAVPEKSEAPTESAAGGASGEKEKKKKGFKDTVREVLGNIPGFRKKKNAKQEL
ncbi:hypothetical protein AB1Y20_004588 [Prymnesium parvum]|uniref:ShKT domain-containing protein n=1 Tax=Prymnesium parvum TaxID=97485 RepID=A0AB34IXB7_PRYPA